MAAFDTFVCEDKVREFAANEFTSERLRSAQQIATDNGLNGFTVSQDFYNLVERGIEKERLGMLEELCIVEVPFFRLASGFLTGKYRRGGQVDSARSASVKGCIEVKQNQRLLSVLDDIAGNHRVGAASIALAEQRRQRSVASPVGSARTVKQLEPLFASAAVELSDEEAAALNNP